MISYYGKEVHIEFSFLFKFYAKNKTHISFTGRDLDAAKIVTEVSTKAEDVAISIDEKQPLISRDQVITIDAVSRFN